MARPVPAAVKKLVRIGSGAKLDPACRVGEMPGRKIPLLKLSLGASARIRMGAVLYLLKPGEYTLRLADASGNPLAPPSAVTIAGPRTHIEFALPPRVLCKLDVAPSS